MHRKFKSRLAVLAAAVVVAAIGAAPTQAAQQQGLVNVNLEDITVLAPVSVAANVCDLAVGVLAQQARAGGAECDATAQSIATPGNGGGGNTSQRGLVNVNIEDVEVLAPISVAANVCDVAVGVLARQVRRGGAECTATAESIATPGRR